MRLLLKLFLVSVIIILGISCKRVPVSHWFPVTPQEHYEQELYKAKAEKTVSGQTWFKAGKQVLMDTLFSTIPHQERFYLGDSVPAQSIRLKIPEGRKLVISTFRSEDDSLSNLFVELFRIKTNGKPQRIEYLKTNENRITLTDNEGDTLIIRIQTGLNEKIRVSLSLTTEPTLSFPLARYGIQNLISFWGAQRDGGVRSHEGIDIKAPRGTPVVAVENGFITQTGTNNLGGKIVFLSASGSPYSIYYAHLDSQLVSVGQRVVRGDTLGLVGNTGNAITTAPHLHFGIYTRGSGAVDPFPFINDKKEKLASLPVKSTWLGDSVRIKNKVNVYSMNDFSNLHKLRVLPKNEIIRILSELPKGYRIALLDGTKGYVPAIGIESLDKQATGEKTKTAKQKK
ncbi:M23 family metallopeptidase [Dyadobacter sp. 3J3]|uniref:M23 family metallopeptidase n=1 Tax=Dyadobacter sp. 3J3 TaxID=2606600 RepID=UPI001359B82F|nr:M23 family metallopeptidase [Dyadobacter sp. 3J3]